jgi:hypothetical protein
MKEKDEQWNETWKIMDEDSAQALQEICWEEEVVVAQSAQAVKISQGGGGFVVVLERKEEHWSKVRIPYPVQKEE